ncbi:phage holin family protein [Tenacibaculum xiamenense]|uniref:phage holin family protein n=1 Tax=Tenacibaculum xiamenense TaxID=1261553 RepID=UPI0038B5AC37
MKFFLKLLLTAFAVIVLAKILPGVFVTSYITALIVAFTIALLNMVVRPLLIFFTLPATIVTLGLFLFVINALIIMLADKLVDGFAVNGFFTALIFSVLLSIFRSFLFTLLKEEKNKE